jgi:hypothetical protein
MKLTKDETVVTLVIPHKWVVQTPTGYYVCFTQELYDHWDDDKLSDEQFHDGFVWVAPPGKTL